MDIKGQEILDNSGQQTSPLSENINPNPKKINTKIVLAALLVFIIGLFIGAFGYWWVQSIDTVSVDEPKLHEDTALIEDDLDGWLDFSSETFPFKFKYRPDLTIVEVSNNSININYLGELDPYDRLFLSNISIIDNPNNYLPAQYAELVLCQNAVQIEGIDAIGYCTDLVEDSMETYENGEVVGIKTIYNLYENPTLAIIFPYENRLIIFTAVGETGGGPTEMAVQTIDRILSTFEFVAIEPATSYTNREFGFSFNLQEGEQVVECLDTNPNTNSIQVWLTTEPQVPQYSGQECMVNGLYKSISATRDDTEVVSLEEYVSVIKGHYDQVGYSVTENAVQLNGVIGVRLLAERTTRDPSPTPVPETIDQWYFYHNGIGYVIDTPFYDKDFRFTSD